MTVEVLRDKENAPSDPLGAIEIGGSPLLPSFSEEMIQEARALKTLSIEGAHGREIPFRDYFTRVEDTTGLSDLEVSRKDLGEASSLFNEEQQALNRASALHREAFSRSRAELSRYEADIQRLTEERNALNLLGKQKEEQIKDLRAELSTAHKDQTDLIKQVMKILKTHGLDSGRVANISISQLQQKIEKIEQFREEVEIQLQGMKDKSLTQARKIEELEARLASELDKAKYEAEKAKAEADTIVAVYQADAKSAQVQAREVADTTQTRAYWIAELARCQSRRETLEEIHARGFDLTKAREHEAKVGALATSDDNDDDDGNKSGSKNREDLDREEAAPGEDQEP
ncbi:uncharacterized protein [Nicotiana tomentosiformis]|uniref:uncharacterized protein n=1 Tax=Nicotiana tomentosiformis TaxID=4098 RepID=UPI00388C48AE